MEPQLVPTRRLTWACPLTNLLPCSTVVDHGDPFVVDGQVPRSCSVDGLAVAVHSDGVGAVALDDMDLASKRRGWQVRRPHATAAVDGGEVVIKRERGRRGADAADANLHATREMEVDEAPRARPEV